MLGNKEKPPSLNHEPKAVLIQPLCVAAISNAVNFRYFLIIAHGFGTKCANSVAKCLIRLATPELRGVAAGSMLVLLDSGPPPQHASRMSKFLTGLLSLFFGALQYAQSEVLIVADEIPAMQGVAAHLKTEEGIDSRIVKQTEMPSNLAGYQAVIVYIHLKLDEPAEKAFIAYAQGGGKLIVLHHSISSGKRKNKEWFAFLGITLPEGDVSQGGYKWIEPVTLDFVNLAPDHFITTHKVKYPARIAYKSSETTAKTPTLPGFTLKDSEVYINHEFTAPSKATRQILLGFKYADAATGKVYMQDRAGWIRPAGKGWIIYLLPGHSASDFQDPTYARIVCNAIIYRP
jgi:hypothetical protein